MTSKRKTAPPPYTAVDASLSCQKQAALLGTKDPHDSLCHNMRVNSTLKVFDRALHLKFTQLQDRARGLRSGRYITVRKKTLRWPDHHRDGCLETRIYLKNGAYMVNTTFKVYAPSIPQVWERFFYHRKRETAAAPCPHAMSDKGVDTARFYPTCPVQQANNFLSDGQVKGGALFLACETCGTRFTIFTDNEAVRKFSLRRGLVTVDEMSVELHVTSEIGRLLCPADADWMRMTATVKQRTNSSPTDGEDRSAKGSHV